MSTRAQVKITDSFGQELWFYRHSDGYPEGTLPSLEKFLDWVKEGRIRDNAEQAAGWLILIGAQERDTKTVYNNGDFTRIKKETLTEPGEKNDVSGWKCGSYEPCACGDLHGDVEFLYTISLEDKTIEVKEL